MSEEFVSVSEAAARLNISDALVRRWCHDGEIPALKIGKTWVIMESDLDTNPPIGEWA